MGKMITVMLFGVVMCCVSAGGAWYVQNHVLSKPESTEAKANVDPNALPTETPSSLQADGSLGVNPVTPPAIGKSAEEERLPVAMRPREMSVEELLRYSMNVKGREEKVKQSEELLQRRRVQQQLALADIEGERREIDGLRVQVNDQLKQAEALIEKLNEVRSKFKEEKEAAADSLQQMKHERITISEEHMDNTKRLSMWVQSMAPEKAAEVLTSMANDGPDQMEIAVQILRNLEEREAAKILSAIDDTKLVQQLIEKFRNLQRPPAKSANRR